MPIQNHFTASIFNYKGFYFNGMEYGNSYFYDGMHDNGKIFKIDNELNIKLNNTIKYLFIYSKKL